MDDSFTGLPATPPPLTEAGLASLGQEVLRQLASLPIPADALITRSMWVIAIGVRGPWTRAVLPVNNRRGRPEPAAIASCCDLVAMLITRGSLPHESDTALVVLHRPGAARVSASDRYIFRMLCEETARRDTARWTFCVATPYGAQELGSRGQHHRITAK